MRFRGPALVGRAEADGGAHGDDRGALVRPGGLDGGLDGGQVVAVRDALRVPAVGREARQHVLRPGHAGRPVELDVVVVVEHGQLAQAQMAGQAGCLRGDALLEVAIGADDPGPMIDDGVAGAVELLGQATLGDGHADGVAEALAERAGGGFHARRHAVLGVAWRARPELAEALQLIERKVVSGEVQHRVEQHAGVASAEHEAVAVEPIGSGRGVLQEARPQGVGHGRGAHRGTGMTAVGLLDAVDGEGPDGVDGQLLVDGRGVAGQDRAPCVSRPARVGTRGGGAWGPASEARRVVGRKVVGTVHDTGDSHRHLSSEPKP